MRNIREGLMHKELIDLVHNEIHIDEFQAKMGDDDQVIVVSFMVKYRSAARDFESFLEKGYDYILDSASSNTEFEDGWYLVFVEFERRLAFPDQLMDILIDIQNITNIEPEEWVFGYGPTEQKNVKIWKVTKKNLKKVVPLSPKKYRTLENDQEDDTEEFENFLMASNVKIPSNNVLSEYEYNLRLDTGLSVDGYKIRNRGKR